MTPVFRAMTAADLGAVIGIQAEAYVDEMLESTEVIRSRFDAVPECAWVVEVAHQVCGYLVGYQAPLGKLTPWGAEFEHAPDVSSLYLHDLAVSRRARGLKLGPALVAHALAEVKQRKIESAALISVQNSRAFWRSLGFDDFQLEDEIQLANLASYAGPAFYMVRPNL
jgi:ribosomal protein S18 acetylase RimI-like enzyme